MSNYSLMISLAQRRDHVTPTLHTRRRVSFKTAVLVSYCAPDVLQNLCPRSSTITVCRLYRLDASDHPKVPTSTRHRRFVFYRPAVWSSLPPALNDNSQSVTEHFQNEAGNAYFRATTNIILRLCSVSAILAPRQKPRGVNY